MRSGAAPLAQDDSLQVRSQYRPDHRQLAGPPPRRLQRYLLPAPNGVKLSIMLEECGLPCEPPLVDFATNDPLSPAFLSWCPNHKILAILDPDGPGGQPMARPAVQRGLGIPARSTAA